MKGKKAGPDCQDKRRDSEYKEYQGTLFGGFEPATKRPLKKRYRKTDPRTLMDDKLEQKNRDLKRRRKERAEKVRKTVKSSSPVWYLKDEALEHNK